MSSWKFILIDRYGTRTEVPEPLNWDNPTVEIAREKQNGWHGVFFDYSIDKLDFDGLGATILKNEYEQYGANGDMHVDILFKCSEDNLYDVFYKNGKIAFDQYSDTCGDECIVTVAVEDSMDIMLYKKNYEQNVNINKNIAFDQTTILTDYTYLGWELTIPNRGLPQTVGGNSPGAQHSIYPIEVRLLTPIFGTAIRIRPELTENSKSEIAVSDPTGSNSYMVYPQTSPNLYPTGISPLLELSDNITCYSGVFNYKIRLKGHIKEQAANSRDIKVLIDVVNEPWEDIGDPTLHEVTILSQTHYESGNGPDFDFDVSFEGSCTIEEGNSFNVFINFVTLYGTTVNQYVYVDWDKLTDIQLSAVSNCAPTTARSYMINETASRVVEAITNNRIRFYSETFGRTDSQPYSINFDPCPGLFSITSGLNIRRKLLIDNTLPNVNMSAKQLFDGLNPLWNIGQTIEPDPNRKGYQRLRFEYWKYFYQDDVVIYFNFPTKVTRSVDPDRLFNQLNIGYSKWQAEGTTGLYELMTKRNYRINVNSESKSLEKYTDFICSPYTIEITRRKDQTTEDWQYDNDIFGFCLIKDEDSYRVETFLDNATDISNVIDQNTCYNANITPARMAMRQFDWVIQGLRKIYADSKLIFAKGEGNYVAALKTTTCNIEGSTIAENEDIDITDFEDIDDGRPITFPELVQFDHAMNYNTFKRIKDDPTIRYKAVSYRCNGIDNVGWIDSISYKPMEGIATIILIPKNNLAVSDVAAPCSAQIGSLSMTPDGDGKMIISWSNIVAGTTFYNVIITKDGQPYSSTNVTTTSLSLSGLPPGDYGIIVIPYCDVNLPGTNYSDGSFSIVAPTFNLELSAVLTTGKAPNNKLQLTCTGSIASPYGFSFKFGQCCMNASIAVEYCSAFPGSIPETPFATVSFNTGDTIKMVESKISTPGADFGYITKVVLYDLVGITPAQITKAAGQTWTLEFK